MINTGMCLEEGNWEACHVRNEWRAIPISPDQDYPLGTDGTGAGVEVGISLMALPFL